MFVWRASAQAPQAKKLTTPLADREVCETLNLSSDEDEAMIVLGTSIPEGAVQAGLAAMAKQFVAADVERAMRPAIHAHMRMTTPDCSDQSIATTAMRAADRLIQREKKAGTIRFNQLHRCWNKAT